MKAKTTTKQERFDEIVTSLWNRVRAGRTPQQAVDEVYPRYVGTASEEPAIVAALSFLRDAVSARAAKRWAKRNIEAVHVECLEKEKPDLRGLMT